MRASFVDDAELTRRAAGGDGEAFEVLFERWADRAFDVAWHIVGDRDAAAAVTEDAFALAWQEVHNLPPQFGSWLLCVTRDLGLHRIQLAAIPDGPDGPDRGRTNVMWLAPAALGAAGASLLSLHLRHGLGPDELAGGFGGDPDAAHEHLRHLMHKLGEAVGKSGQAQPTPELFAAVPIVGAGATTLGRMVGSLADKSVPAKIRAGSWGKPPRPGAAAHGKGVKPPWWAGRVGVLGAAATVTVAVAVGAVAFVVTGPSRPDKDGSGVEAGANGGDKSRTRDPSGGTKVTTTTSTSTSLPDASTTSSSVATTGSSRPIVTTPGPGGPPNTTPEDNTTSTTAPTTTTSTTDPPPPAPVITSFVASRSNRTCQDQRLIPVRFGWASTNGSSARLGPQDGGATDVPVNAQQHETCSVRGAAWTLSVTGPGGTVTASTNAP